MVEMAVIETASKIGLPRALRVYFTFWVIPSHIGGKRPICYGIL